tara:strand:+ start:8078 stop:8605 length:528 start_codon:yes stop_codon:yes gene_type:complete
MNCKAYIVSGPESSGNRLVASILVRSGCLGEGSTAQPRAIDDIPEATADQPFVMIAHHGLPIWIRRLRHRGYRDIKVIVIVREPIANVVSMVNRGHVKDHERGHKIRTATIAESIGDSLRAGAELHITTYEGLNEDALRQWLPMIGLNYVGGPLELTGQVSRNWITNENAKHYEG